jgi:large subunit ribosomal protein L16
MLKKKRVLLFRKLPYVFTTKKPSEVRMGKGKGSHHQWVCPIKIGQILIEFKFIKLSLINQLIILRKCIKRLPVKAKIISKNTKKLATNLITSFF